MSAATYTEHKLTDAMLQRLSKITKGRDCGGVSIGALEARGLIERRVSCARHGAAYGQDADCGCGDAKLNHVATEAGTAALARARAEGW